MPPGTLRPRPTIRLRERATAEACLAIAHRVEEACRSSGDQSGLAAARRISQAIREELLPTQGSSPPEPPPRGCPGQL